MPNKGSHFGVALSAEGVAKVRRELDTRCWMPADWAQAAGVDKAVVYRYLQRRHIKQDKAEALQKAILETEPIEGLAELLAETAG